MWPQLVERDAGSLGQRAGRLRDDDLPRPCGSEHARRGVNGDSPNVARDRFDLAGVNADADPNPQILRRANEGEAATDGPRGPVEHDEEAVARRRDLPPTERVDHLTGPGIVSKEQLPPRDVPDALQ